MNGKRITASGAGRVADALLAVSFPAHITPQSPDIGAFLRIAPLCQAIRRTGSAALNLAYVACGRLDGHWAHEIHPWDAAAGVLLVQEAGGVATASDGGPFNLAEGNYLAAATADLHAQLAPLVRRP
jgi:myo-inositol-1(or 4)-monophosphatase